MTTAIKGCQPKSDGDGRDGLPTQQVQEQTVSQPSVSDDGFLEFAAISFCSDAKFNKKKPSFRAFRRPSVRINKMHKE